MRYYVPKSCDEALAVLASAPVRILAGGTDRYPALRDRPLLEDTLDISRIPDLRGVTKTEDGWRIGAATTWTDVARAPLPACFQGLQAAARQVGSLQIQNAGTVAGNLCNASPAADGVPPLLTLDASVEIASLRGRRSVPLSSFLVGVRKIDLLPDEMVTAVTLPEQRGTSAFLKLGSRKYLVISIAMVAVILEADDDGGVDNARIAVGSCSPVARRLQALETELKGQPMRGNILSEKVRPDHLACLSPIDDVRGDAGYRLSAVEELLRRALRTAVEQTEKVAA